MSPTDDEIYRFRTDGYLLIEQLLTTELVTNLSAALDEVVIRRRLWQQEERRHVGHTQINGPNTRILHILDDHPLFLQLLDYPPVMAHIRCLLSERPHFHASDGISESGVSDNGPAWHIDGYDNGYRSLRPHIPLLQLKIGYFLSDMVQTNQGNLTIVPGSHHNPMEPSEAQLAGFTTMPGAEQICCPTGSCIMFHNALWHTRGPATRLNGKRRLLYYAYEHPWMIGNPEHWQYSEEFYCGLSPERRQLFHGFAFSPPENRWN